MNSTGYTLIGSTTSPYVRKIRILLCTLKITNPQLQYEFKSINYLDKNDSDYLKSINPINKIPVVLVGDQKIYDSRVIYNYFAKNHHLKPFSIEDENILSSIDAAMDTSINLFSLRRGGLDLKDSNNSYIIRQLERVPLILNDLTTWVKQLDEKNPTHWNFLTMSLYSYLYWANFREVIDLNDYPACKIFIEHFQHSPGVESTIPT